jgi:hypothetical protein
MNAFLAFIGDSEPGYYNARTILLLIALVVMAHLISPVNPMARKERQGLVMIYPAIIFVYWILFQFKLISLNPFVHYYLGPSQAHAWVTNSFLCFAFGAAFSVVILLAPGIGRRLYGGAFLALYLFLLVTGLSFRPPVMSL